MLPDGRKGDALFPHPPIVLVHAVSYYKLTAIWFPQQAEQSKEEKKQGLSAEKLMRKASKDVCRLREQSQKVPLQVQSFR